MKDLKNYIALGICAVLTVTGGVMSGGNVKKGVEVGAGNGVSEKVETVEEFASVWDAAGTLLLGATDPMPFAMSDKEDSKKEYTSVTIEMNSQSSTSMFSPGDSEEERTKSVMDRKMTCSFTETEAYYNIDATIYNYTPVLIDHELYGSSTSTIDMCFEMYINEDYSAIRFSRFNIDQSKKDKDGNVEKDESGLASMSAMIDMISGYWLASDWIGGDYIFQTVNQSNYLVFETFGKYLDRSEEEGVFNKRGSVYTLTKEYSNQMMLDLIYSILGVPTDAEAYDKVFGVVFKADLSMPQQPMLSCTYSTDYSAGGRALKAFDRQSFTLKHINNTVIHQAPTADDLLSETDMQNIIASRGGK